MIKMVASSTAESGEGISAMKKCRLAKSGGGEEKEEMRKMKRNRENMTIIEADCLRSMAEY